MTNPTAPAAPDFDKMARRHFIGDDVMSKALRGAFIDGAIQGLASSSAELEQRVGESERTMRGYQMECAEVEQILGKALGYPWLKDDQANFPGATEVDGVCVGEHVPGSIAAEAANKIAQLARRVRELEEEVWCAHLEEQESEDARQYAVAALAAARQNEKSLTAQLATAHQRGAEAEACAIWNLAQQWGEHDPDLQRAAIQVMRPFLRDGEHLNNASKRIRLEIYERAFPVLPPAGEKE